MRIGYLLEIKSPEWEHSGLNLNTINFYSKTIVISTRRFACLPSGVSLLATGFDSPKPKGLTRFPVIPLAISKVFTAFARFSDKIWLELSFPILSVCPSTKS